MPGLWIEKNASASWFRMSGTGRKKMQLLKYHGKRISIMFVFMKNFEKKTLLIFRFAFVHCNEVCVKICETNWKIHARRMCLLMCLWRLWENCPLRNGRSARDIKMNSQTGCTQLSGMMCSISGLHPGGAKWLVNGGRRPPLLVARCIGMENYNQAFLRWHLEQQKGRSWETGRRSAGWHSRIINYAGECASATELHVVVAPTSPG